jgi:hypothetical protein
MCRACPSHAITLITKQPNLKLKTQPIQLLGHLSALWLSRRTLIGLGTRNQMCCHCATATGLHLMLSMSIKYRYPECRYAISRGTIYHNLHVIFSFILTSFFSLALTLKIRQQPVVNVIKLFPSSPTEGQNKLERLCLWTFFCQASLILKVLCSGRLRPKDVNKKYICSKHIRSLKINVMSFRSGTTNKAGKPGQQMCPL